jgi:hypothetical protein
MNLAWGIEEGPIAACFEGDPNRPKICQTYLYIMWWIVTHTMPIATGGQTIVLTQKRY